MARDDVNTQITEHQIRKRLPAKRESVTWMRTKFGIKRPGWCVLHNDFAWIYSDGSEGCWYDCVVESTNEHDIVPIVVELPPRARSASVWASYRDRKA